ncbi:MAG TPA: hypothetical protein VGQ42_07230 [Candidatus Dormibacteraeota bacterium]|jgi:hypothetical protein|nr:hypothetical protein [Candidatus Dormibacteraeota bacterium]
MTTKRSVTSALALCALLAACGSSGGTSGGGDEASKPPAQIVADAAAALKAAKTFHLSAKVHDTSSAGGQLDLEIDAVAPSTASGTVTSAGVTAHFIFTAGKLYFQGKQFLASLSTQVADLVGDKWALLPAASASSFSSISDPSKLATCLVESHGTLSKGGTASVNGQTAVVVVDAGDKPGTSPGKLYVAASGTAYPLKLESTATAGSSSSSSSSTSTDTSPTPSSSSATDCGSGTSGTAGDVATFSKFDASVSVTPPPDAVDLSKLGG